MATLRVRSGHYVVEVAAPGQVTFGRDENSDVRLADDRISRQHAVARWDNGSWVFEDLGSSNGSFMQGDRVRVHQLARRTLVRLANPVDGPAVELTVNRETRPWIVAVPTAFALILAGLVVAGNGTMDGLISSLSVRTVPTAEPIGSASPNPTETPAPTPSPTPAPLSRADVAAIGTAGTVYVEVGNGHGSGIYLGRDRVITADHVIANSRAIRVHFGSFSAAGKVLARDPRSDLALLQVDGLGAAGARPLSWGDISQLRAGDELVAIGYPLYLPLTVQAGVLSGVQRFEALELIQTDANLNPGMSGGPILDGEGRVVGVSVLTNILYPGLGLAVSATTARPFEQAN